MPSPKNTRGFSRFVIKKLNFYLDNDIIRSMIIKFMLDHKWTAWEKKENVMAYEIVCE